MTENKDFLNHRVLVNDSFGTIKYVGLVEGTDQDIWYGIEWDDPSRGKHDGSYKGKKYFHTEHKTGGSFVKANKIDFGVDIYAAAKEKYLAENDFDKNDKKDENADEIIYNNTGFIEKLQCVALSMSRINSLNSIDQFSKMFPCIRELELDGNLLHSWTEILNALNQLKSLRLLNVSNNRLCFTDDSNNSKCENINFLILNSMNYDWNDVVRITRHFPNLTQLKVCFNKITKIDQLSESMIDNIEVLDLESNQITEFQNLLKLGELKKLEHLYINHIGIKSIEFNDAGSNEKTKFFPKLKSLSLNQNKIDQWKTVNELGKLTALEELRFNFNPLNETDRASNIRQLFTAKIGSLRIFNRTIIISNERQGSEYDYLKIHCEEYVNVSRQKDEGDDNNYKKFINEHPRYLKLIETYGLPEVVVVKPETVKSSLVSVNLVDDETKETLVRKLPLSMTVQRLKPLAAKLFAKCGIDNDCIKLVYKSSKQLGDEYELENDYRDLKFYAVEDDDLIILKLL